MEILAHVHLPECRVWSTCLRCGCWAGSDSAVRYGRPRYSRDKHLALAADHGAPAARLGAVLARAKPSGVVLFITLYNSTVKRRTLSLQSVLRNGVTGEKAGPHPREYRYTAAIVKVSEVQYW